MIRREWVNRLIASAGITIIVGCHGFGDLPSSTSKIGCRDNVTVTVSSGITPTIDWTPSCPVNRVTVDVVNGAPGSIATVWDISSSSGVFGPPLTYGVAPAEADGQDAPVALVPGRTYQVIVYYVGAEISYGGGQATFTP
jgi:hypothetical protein